MGKILIQINFTFFIEIIDGIAGLGPDRIVLFDIQYY